MATDTPGKASSSLPSRRPGTSDARVAQAHDRLEEWAWEWGHRRGREQYQDRWQTAFAILDQFIAANGRFPELGSTDDDEQRLARWVKTQRERLPHSVEQVALARLGLLSELPGWKPLKISWNERADELDRFISEHSRLPRRSNTASQPERDLNAWLSRQLRRQKASTPEQPFRPDRSARLTSLMKKAVALHRQRGLPLAGPDRPGSRRPL